MPKLYDQDEDDTTFEEEGDQDYEDAQSHYDHELKEDK
jgi:hypothetical protein